MFVHAIPDNKGNRDGFFCTLVESQRVNGKPVHKTLRSFGYVPSERLPYLKAAFNAGDPETILAEAKSRLERKEEE